MKNGKKTYISGEIPVNDCRNVEGVEIYKINFKNFFTYLKSFMQRIIQKPILKLTLSNIGPYALFFTETESS